MALIQKESDVATRKHLFCVPATLTERWNTRYCELVSQAAYDDAPDPDPSV